MNHEHERLEQMLSARSHEPMSADLAERILLRARSMPQRITLWQMLEKFCRELHMPSPAYAFSALLAVGFALGLTMQQEMLDSGDNNEWQIVQEAYDTEEASL